MFSSSRKIEPAMPMATADVTTTKSPAPNGAAEVSRAGGVLSSGVSIKGSVKFQKELLIDGEVEGKIDSSGRLTIGVNAKIRRVIRTKSVIVKGTVEGNITIMERLEVSAGCTIIGVHKSLRMDVDTVYVFIGC